MTIETSSPHPHLGSRVHQVTERRRHRPLRRSLQAGCCGAVARLRASGFSTDFSVPLMTSGI
eukprot:7254283-Alexandrium_andersonii.AAC.1